MLGVHEKNLPPFVDTDQINYTNHVRLFILSVFFISLLDYVLFGFFYSFSTNIFTTWMSICLSILFCFYCICHFSIKHYSSVRFAHKTRIAFQIICFFTGSLLGISTIIINYF